MIELLLVFLVFGILGVLLLSMNWLLGPKRSTPLKETPFECGSPPLETGIKPFSIKFAVIAFLFLIFDIEIIFFFPWALVFREMTSEGMAVMAVFVLVLAVGFVYAWRKGAFQWD
ncbi:MAG TPA: NADH-quinone oxidoreductase subunit A [Acidobacteriota bacterium]